MTARGAGLGLVALLVVGVGVGLRVVALDLGWFGIDQARDVATALDVAGGLDAPTIGPTMRRVVRLGAGYYYFWAVPYLVSGEPLAGYWFAAGLSVVAMLVVAALAHRLWGPRSGLLTLAFAATHPVWVIDGRVAWAPAALPAAGALLLWLLLASRAPLGAWRAALVGALLGLAVQLHLTMVAWVLAIGLVVLLERPAFRVALAGIVGGLLTGLPALLALVGGSADDGGLGSLAGADAIPIAARARAAVSLGWRVPTALSRWTDVEVGGWSLAVASAAMAVLVVCGLGRLLWRGAATRPARLALALAVIGGGLVLALPGEAWWYYLDGLLPVAALLAGAAVAGDAARPSRASTIGTVAGLAAGVVLAAQLATWLYEVDRHGYMAVDPHLLTLDPRPGDDAAVPGRMVSVRWQRAFAEHAAAGGGSFEDLWQRLHGPALGDVAGDNGFWLRWALAARGLGRDASGEGRTHLAVWYDDAPVVAALGAASAAAGLELTTIGPLRVARYTPAIDYASCRAADGPVAVPVRVAPHPKRYGDGRPQRPRDLPTRIDCTVHPGTTPVHIVARLDGPGTVRVRANGTASVGAPEANLCLDRASVARSFTIELALPPGAAVALDLYEIPAAPGCPRPRVPGPNA